jgi:riboflavin synthase alpha subunit
MANARSAADNHGGLALQIKNGSSHGRTVSLGGACLTVDTVNYS